METVHKNDFIEIELTGKANEQVFDTTDKEEAKKIGYEGEIKPLIVSVGNQMLLKAFDDFLEGKEIGEKYSLHLSPEKAFGKRDPTMIKTISMKFFREKEMNPYPGLTLQTEMGIAKVISVSGGRVSIDFNNPLAGKEIDYEFKIKKKIIDNKEKVDALQDFFLRNRFEFEIKDNKVIFKDPSIKPFVEIFKQKFKDMTGLDFEVEEKKE